MTSKNIETDADGRQLSSSNITALEPDEVFVFGSNSDGEHGGGAARFAHANFGAVWGQGHGLHGNSYAIDTMSGFDDLAADVADFLKFANDNPTRCFLLTEIGCGIAGYAPAEVAPLFSGVPNNVMLPASFSNLLS